MFDAETLYNMLPVTDRVRDTDGSLRAECEALAREIAAVQAQIDASYDDLFIETCTEWLIPYLGDLVDAHLVHEAVGGHRRTQVANTVDMRRRRGTAVGLQQMAQATVQWPVHTVEFFRRIAKTADLSLNQPPTTLDLRANPTWRNTPFDGTLRTPSIRGPHAADRVGLFIWRIQAYPVVGASLHPIDDAGRRCLVSPFGNDTALFVRPIAPENVPLPLRREMGIERHYGNSLQLIVNDYVVPVDEIVIGDLSLWQPGPDHAFVLDPELGRVLLPDGFEGEARITYCYGFGTELGGGSYTRAMSGSPSARINRHAPNLQTVLDRGGIVEITDSTTYTGDLRIPAVGDVVLRAANGQVPALLGTLTIDASPGAEITLDGLRISGPVLVNGNPRQIRLQHCIIVPGVRLFADGTPQQPGMPGLVVTSPETQVILERCIVGGVRVSAASWMVATDSIIDANAETAVAYASPDVAIPGGPVVFENCTVQGQVRTTHLQQALNTIFLAQASGTEPPVLAVQDDQGDVRFCGVPAGARVPRPHRCQITRPVMTSTRFGDPGYFQLRAMCPVEIRSGADDESEIGVYHHLHTIKREAALRLRLHAFMPLGMQADVFFAS